MSHTTATEKPQFRQFLDEMGWNVPKFCEIARSKGIPVPVGSAHKWARGTQPRGTVKYLLKQRFKGIRF